MSDWLANLLAFLALPQVGLSSLFVIALLSATLLPLGSEAALLALLQLQPDVQPDLFWSAIAVATLGNTLGGAITWWMGAGARQALQHLRHESSAQTREAQALRWLQRFGPKACLLSWLPVIGDPLCLVAGWLRLPFWPCLFYMAIGKFLRYLTLTWGFMQLL
jgi:membrane protein YqaA with SNARE-associated domain